MSPSNSNVPESPACGSVRHILARVGDKWSLYIVGELAKGSRRFMELKREVDGISQRMLTLTLKGLEQDGLVTRTVTPTIPPRVEYELTALGLTLIAPVQGLVTWAETHHDEIQRSRVEFGDR